MKTLRLLLVLLSPIVPLLGQTGKATTESNASCIACHGPESTLSEKKIADLRALSASIHSGLKCIDCHALSTEPAPPGAPHPPKFPDVNCTSRCHREPASGTEGMSPLAYSDSIHGSSYRRGVKEVARCWDCHGKHNIRRSSDAESLSNRLNIPLNCSRCHDDMAVVVKYHIHSEKPYAEYKQSVHGRALAKKEGFEFAAVCTDCHGVHNITGVEKADRMARRPETCGRCHSKEFEQYSRSIHGKEALGGNIDAPLCSDCHGEHNIATPAEDQSSTSRLHIHQTCAACHARPELAEKYGIPEKRVLTFIESRHGIAIELGRKSAATCSSCHGIHDILPAADTTSPVNPLNLPSTCGQKDCHPGMPAAIARARIHRSVEEKDSGAPFTVLNILLVLVVVAMIVTVLWFVPGFLKKARRLRNR